MANISLSFEGPSVSEFAWQSVKLTVEASEKVAVTDDEIYRLPLKTTTAIAARA